MLSYLKIFNLYKYFSFFRRIRLTLTKYKFRFLLQISCKSIDLLLNINKYINVYTFKYNNN